MKMQLVAKAVALSLAIAYPMTINAGGIPVIDGANVMQSTMTTVENIAQTLKQIEQYKTQLQQYENQLQNTMAPAAYIWDQASKTMNNLQSSLKQLQSYRSDLGNIDQYLDKYKSVDFYKSSPCFSAKGCTKEQRAALEQSKDQLSRLQKLSNDGVLKTVDSELAAIVNDAKTLENLQRRTQSASGQMEALQYANQLLSTQANSILQLRNTLTTEIQANATYRQNQIEKEAREEAAAKAATGFGVFKRSR